MDTGYQEHPCRPGALHSARWALLTAWTAKPLGGAPFPLLWVCEPHVGTEETEYGKQKEEEIAKTHGDKRIEVKFKGRLMMISVIRYGGKKAQDYEDRS